MSLYEEVFERNQKWVAEKKNGHEDYFINLAKGQDPEFLFIGCSDSRVPANQIMGMEPGDVFSHRNIANVVSADDLNAIAVIEYAVAHLDVRHIVICGHYGCGGVGASMGNADLGVINPWLQHVRDVQNLHKAELDAIADHQKKYDRLVELNVEEQCFNLMKIPSYQRRYAATGHPVVHGWVFDFHTGYIKDLKLDFSGMLKRIDAGYNLCGKELAH